MKDVQNGLGIKNMCDSLKKQMCGIFESKNITEEQKNSM